MLGPREPLSLFRPGVSLKLLGLLRKFLLLYGFIPLFFTVFTLVKLKLLFFDSFKGSCLHDKFTNDS